MGSNELVVNGDFATDSDWTLQSGATISNNACVFDNVSSTFGVRQDGANFTSGDTVQFSIDVLSISLGQFRFNLDGGETIFIPTDVGTYKYTYIVGSGGSGRVNVLATGTTSGIIDNVSVKEIIEVAS